MNTKEFLNSIKGLIYALLLGGGLNISVPQEVAALPQPALTVCVSEQSKFVLHTEQQEASNLHFDSEAITAAIEEYVAQKGWQTVLNEMNKALEVVTFFAQRLDMEQSKAILSRFKEDNSDFSSAYFLADLQNFELDFANEKGINVESAKILCKNLAYYFHVLEWNSENDFDDSDDENDDELSADEMQYWTQEGAKRLHESIINNDAVFVQIS